MNPTDDDDGVPPGGRFDKETYERARAAVLQQQQQQQQQQQLDEQSPAPREARSRAKSSAKPASDTRAQRAYRGQRADTTPVRYSGVEAANDFEREARPGRRGPALYGNTFQPEKSAEARRMRAMDEPPAEKLSVNERIKKALGFAQGGAVERKASKAGGAGDVTPPPGMRGKPPTFRKPPPAEAGAGDVTPKYAKGGSVGAKRGDGCCQRGYTKGKFV
jgi:hypothetical protein